MQNIGSREFFLALGIGLLHSLFTLFVVLSSVWLCLALWIQQPLGSVFSRIVIVVWTIFALSLIGVYVSGHLFSRRTDIIIYCLAFKRNKTANGILKLHSSFIMKNKVILSICIIFGTLAGIQMEAMKYTGKIAK